MYIPIADLHSDYIREFILSLAKLIRLGQKKQAAKRIIALACFDAPFAALASHSGSDILLIDDSQMFVYQGYRNARPPSLKEIIYHTACVARGNEESMIISSLPTRSVLKFDKVIEDAVKLIEAGAEAIKLVYRDEMLTVIRELTCMNIPVCVQIDILFPAFSKHHNVNQGKTNTLPSEICSLIKTIERAGAAMIFLRNTPSEISTLITVASAVPVIGDDKDMACDGVMVNLFDFRNSPPLNTRSSFDVYDRENVCSAIRKLQDPVTYHGT